MLLKRKTACRFALLALLFCVLTACSRTVTEDALPAVVLGADELSQYTIVRPDFADDRMVRCGMNVRESLLDAGVTLRLTTDFYREGIEDFEIREKEILVGDTNRAETAAFLDELLPWQWGYGLVNGKIVIAGHDGESTALAVGKFTEDIVRREPLSFSSDDRYIDGATYEGTGRVYSLLAADLSPGQRTDGEGMTGQIDGPSVDAVLDAVREYRPGIVVLSGLREAESDSLGSGMDGYLAGVRTALGDRVTAIYYDAAQYTYSSGDRMPLLTYGNLTEEEKGAFVYTVLRSAETGNKMTFAAVCLPEDQSAGARMKTVAGFLRNSARIPAAVTVTGLTDKTADAADSRFLAYGYADARALTAETEGDGADQTAVYLPYEKLTAVRVTGEENGIVYMEFQKTKN